MITLKYWNSLSPACRTKIAEKFFNTEHFALEVREEYHHNFNFDSTGRMLKVLLGNCYLRNGHIEIVCTLIPTFTPKEQKGHKVAEDTCHRYYFRIYTKNDPEDGETVWEDAHSEQEARNMVYEDYHSIIRMDLIRRS